MRVINQTIDEIVATLQPLTVGWMDEVARRVIDKIETLPVKPLYTEADVTAFLDDHFDDGLLICRLFLGLSQDQFMGMLRGALGEGGAGVTRYRKDRAGFLEGLLSLGLLEAMTAEANRPLRWSNVLVERLRSGRGSAISGQKRGRDVEDFAIAVVRKVFGTNFVLRRNFIGARSQTAEVRYRYSIESRATHPSRGERLWRDGLENDRCHWRHRENHRRQAPRHGFSLLHGWRDLEATAE